MALLLALARNVPQAHAALVDGPLGALEVLAASSSMDKTLGILGFGRIGQLVAERAKGFGMRVARLRPVRQRRALPRAGRREGRVLRRGLRRGRLPHDPPAQDAGDRGLARRRGVREDARTACAILNVARGPLIVDEDLAGRARLRQGRRRGARRLPLRAGHRAPAVRLPQRRRHAAPRRLDRRGDRPRRLPGRRADRRRAERRQRHDRGQRRRRSRPRTSRCSGRSCRSAAALGRLGDGARRGLARSTAIEVECLGRIAERDTRPLGIAVAARRARGHTEEDVNAVNAPLDRRGARDRARRDARSTHARDFTDLVRVTVVARRASASASSARRSAAAHRPHLLEAWGQRFNLQLERPRRAVPLPRRAGHDRPRRHGASASTA